MAAFVIQVSVNVAPEVRIAWILMLYFPIHPLIMIALDKPVGVGDISKKMKEAQI